HLDNRAAAVNEDVARALEALENEALSTEEPRPQTLGELDVDVHLSGGAEKRIALAEHGAVLQRHPDDLARVRSAERDLGRGGVAAEKRQEEALAREHLALERAQEPAGHPRVHLDAVGHIGHR